MAAALAADARQRLRKDPTDAASMAVAARLAARLENDRETLFDGWKVLGQAQSLRGKFAAAVRALRRAESLEDEPDGRVAALMLHPLIHLERYDEARRVGARCLDRLASARDVNVLIMAHMALADLAFRSDAPARALRHYEMVERHLPEAASAQLRAVLASNRANALEACNRFDEAEACFQEARSLLDDDAHGHTRAQVDYNAAYLELMRGRYDRALTEYTVAEAAFTRLADERHLALIDLERAEIHLRLNMPHDAVRLAAAAARRFERLGMRKEQAQVRFFEGQAARLLENNVAASAAFNETYGLFKELGMMERAAACVVQLGHLALDERGAEPAMQHASQAGAMLRSASSPLSRASVEILKAKALLRKCNDDQAVVHLRQAEEYLADAHAPWAQIEIHRLSGSALRAGGDARGALVAYRAALDVLERYRGGVPPDEYMACFLAARADLYLDAVELLVALGENDAAFELAERAKSRALIDLLSGRVTRGVGGATEILDRVAKLREQLHAIYRRLFEHQAGSEKRSARALREARIEACEIEDEIHALLREAHWTDAEQTSLDHEAGINVDDVRRHLDANTALVEYVVTNEAVLAFVVTRTNLQVVHVDVQASTIRGHLDRFRFHLGKFDRKTIASPELVYDATRANLEQLSELIFEPLLPFLSTRRIVVVPHSLLHGLPFHALPLGDGWTMDRFEFVYAPSAAVYGYCRGRAPSAGQGAAVFGLPDAAAPEIDREVRAVASHFGGALLRIGDDASLARLREDAAGARHVHIATHGMFRPEHPMLSSIRLADAWLNLYDLYDLRLDAELVVLSTCESGIADVTEGDEVLGLTRGLLYAGARALLTSQWRVNDETTAEFMDHLYRRIVSGTGIAAAVHEAMAEIRKERPHPYYWAPFFLTGAVANTTTRETVVSAGSMECHYGEK
ncbi:MAG: CHAT domain-containing protein [Planctomycetota bacterium]|nr:CHAT domain-containing protein [Planctomycetota bacterium]